MNIIIGIYNRYNVVAVCSILKQTGGIPMKEQPLYIGGQEVMTEKTVPVYHKETNGSL